MLKLKVAQIFPKVAQNVAKAVFIGKAMFFEITQKSLCIWATFQTIYFTQNFRKSPNQVTLNAILKICFLVFCCCLSAYKTIYLACQGLFAF